MTGRNRRTLLSLSMLMFGFHGVFAAEIPVRAISIKPYINVLFPHNLYEDVVKDNVSLGGGLKLQTNLTKHLGYQLDATFNKVEVTGPWLELAAVFTGGIFAHVPMNYLGLEASISYGAISAGSHAGTVMKTTVGIKKSVAKHFYFTTEISSLVANDWFADFGFEEHSGSFSIGTGVGTVF